MPDALPLIITLGWPGSVAAEPEHVAGVHLTMLITRPPDDPGELTGEETRRLQAARQFRATGSGYGAIQRTRPQTLAYGLTDSPARSGRPAEAGAASGGRDGPG